MAELDTAPRSVRHSDKRAYGAWIVAMLRVHVNICKRREVCALLWGTAASIRREIGRRWAIRIKRTPMEGMPAIARDCAAIQQAGQNPQPQTEATPVPCLNWSSLGCLLEPHNP